MGSIREGGIVLMFRDKITGKYIFLMLFEKVLFNDFDSMLLQKLNVQTC